MRSRQAGLTFIGWLVLLVPLAIVMFAGIKLAPLYMTHFKVAKAVQQVADANRGEEVISPVAVRGELEKRFDIESIEEPTVDDVVVEREGGNWVIVADYSRETSLFGSISLLVHFNKRVVLQ